MRVQPPPINKNWFLIVSFILAGVITQYYPIPLLFGVTVNLGAIWYLAVIRFFGLKQAVLVAVLISVLSYMLNTSNPFVFISIFEVIIIGGLFIRKGRNLFTWTFLYSCIAILIMYLGIYLFDSSAWVTIDSFLFLHDMIELSIAALLADTFSVYLPNAPLLKRFLFRESRLYFGYMIFNIIMISTIIPLISLTVMTAWTLEDDVYIQYQAKQKTFEMTINERISQMDASEIQRLHLGSSIEKAHTIDWLDRIIAETNQMVYVIDNEGSLFVNSSNALSYSALKEELVTGMVTPDQSGQSIWVSGTGSDLTDWRNSYYMTTTPFFNMQIELYIPMKPEIQGTISTITTYYFVLMAVFAITFLFGTTANAILTKSLHHLTNMTSDLPEKIKAGEPFRTRTLPIVEFGLLAGNIEKVGQRLEQMFFEVQANNKLLTERTVQLVRSEGKLYHVANFDELTDLPNRHSFYNEIHTLIDTGRECFALAFIDLDRFKEVNDTFGHSGGDELLKRFAKRLIQFHETVEKLEVYRLAGDEFVAIIREDSKQIVGEICNDLHEEINRPILIQNTTIRLTASIGISFYQEDGETVDDLLHAADQAMYQQKNNNKEREGATIANDEEQTNDKD